MINHYIYTFNFDEESEGNIKEVSATVIFCDLPQIEISSLQAEIKTFYQRHYQTDKVFAIGGDYLADELKRVFKDPIQQNETFRYLPRRQDTHLDENLHLITFDKDGNLKGIDFTLTEALEKKLILEGLQQIFIERGGLIKSEGAHHFVFPSGKHCDQFLRTGNILLHSCEINFIAFVLLRHFNEDIYDQIYCDTSSINSVAFALVELKNRFYREDDKKLVPISSFSSYEGLYKNELSYGKNALLLISASTSANIINYILDHHPIIDRENVVILYFLGKLKSFLNIRDKVLCNLTCSEENKSGIPFYDTYEEQDCDLCERGSYPVEVFGDVFLLENPSIEPILLKVTDAQKGLSPFVHQFLSANKKDTVLRVNYKERGNQEEKYEVYIDFVQILKDITRFPNFQAKLHDYIDQYVPSNTRYLLSLNDVASKELSDYILKRIASNYTKRNKPIMVSQDDLTVEISSEAEGTVVVVGSCISKGKNLLYISRALRAFDRLRIVYFIGITRTRDEEYLEELTKNLKQGRYGGDTYTFVTVEIQFCNPESRHTPWVKEVGFLKDFVDFIRNLDEDLDDQVKFFKDRQKFLQKSGGATKGGLTEGLYFPKSGRHSEQLKIGKNFAFFKFRKYQEHATQSDLHFTISNVLNSLRSSTHPKRNLHQSAYVRKLLDPANFSRFNDGIIQAAILRSARPEELAYAHSQELSQEMYDTLETMAKDYDGDQSEGLIEFVYALASRKMSLKKGHLQSLLDLLNEKCADKIILCFCPYIEENVLKDQDKSGDPKD